MNQYVKESEYETIQLEEEWIVMNTDNFTVTKLNGIGGYCWSLLENPQSIQTLTQSVQRHYQLNTDALAKDIEEFIVELINYGLVRHAV
ncbi:PqqD family protein [Metabacillus litoralis]|uniref:PqqD family protein n=1 Tax=Metabacillus litoralis TaxID=152268 RepID=A0A5C6W8Z6_9BACI|nr:PqqD family protein [Metabacillus litoralis]TXC92344.1 PqqD family protein [Metabacillus litoralis]